MTGSSRRCVAGSRAACCPLVVAAALPARLGAAGGPRGRARADALPARAARPDADLDAAARAYVRRQVWRGELRWHPELLTRHARSSGFEHLLRRARARPRRDAQLHAPRLLRRGLRLDRPAGRRSSHMLVYPYMLRRRRAAAGSSSTCASPAPAAASAVSAEVGTAGHRRPAQPGAIVATLASDVPGRTPVRFAGRDVLGSFGAARIAADAGSPVVVMTSEVDEHGGRSSGCTSRSTRRTSSPRRRCSRRCSRATSRSSCGGPRPPTSRCRGGAARASRRGERMSDAVRTGTALDDLSRSTPVRSEIPRRARRGAADPAVLAGRWRWSSRQVVVALDLDLPGACARCSRWSTARRAARPWCCTAGRAPRRQPARPGSSTRSASACSALIVVGLAAQHRRCPWSASTTRCSRPSWRSPGWSSTSRCCCGARVPLVGSFSAVGVVASSVLEARFELGADPGRRSRCCWPWSARSA